MNSTAGSSNAAGLNQVVISGAGSITVYMNNNTPGTITWHAYAVCVGGSSTGSSG